MSQANELPSLQVADGLCQCTKGHPAMSSQLSNSVHCITCEPSISWLHVVYYLIVKSLSCYQLPVFTRFIRRWEMASTLAGCTSGVDVEFSDTKKVTYLEENSTQSATGAPSSTPPFRGWSDMVTLLIVDCSPMRWSCDAQEQVTEGNIQRSEKHFGEETVRSTLDPDGQMNTQPWTWTTWSGHFEHAHDGLTIMTFHPKIKIFPYNPKIRPANPSNKKLNCSGLNAAEEEGNGNGLNEANKNSPCKVLHHVPVLCGVTFGSIFVRM